MGISDYISGIQFCMKKILLFLSIFPLAGLLGFSAAHYYGYADSVDIRTGDWPIQMQRVYDRPGVTYTLQFRDQGSVRAVVMDTVLFSEQKQLRFLAEALVTLKKGRTGDVAEFDTYSIGRADKLGQGTWYVLRDKYGSTDFQQREADMISRTANSW